MSESPARTSVNAHTTPSGDFVSYEAGTHHNSWTENGCLIAVFEWTKNQ